VVGHGGQHPGVNEAVLLAVVLPQNQARVEDPLGGVDGLAAAVGDEPLAEIPLQMGKAIWLHIGTFVKKTVSAASPVAGGGARPGRASYHKPPVSESRGRRRPGRRQPLE
jgi:hypothetical protein